MERTPRGNSQVTGSGAAWGVGGSGCSCGVSGAPPAPWVLMSMHPLHLELFPPAHQETLGCSADLLLMCVDSPRAASCVQAPVCTRVAMLPLRALVLSGPFGAVFCIPWELGNCKLLEALLPSPRDCGVPASLCHFGLKSCPGQVPRAGWGPHQLPHPQAQLGSLLQFLTLHLHRVSLCCLFPIPRLYNLNRPQKDPVYLSKPTSSLCY